MIATAAAKAASSSTLCDLRSSAVAAALVDSVAKPSAARLARTFPVAAVLMLTRRGARCLGGNGGTGKIGTGIFRRPLLDKLP